MSTTAAQKRVGVTAALAAVALAAGSAFGLGYAVAPRAQAAGAPAASAEDWSRTVAESLQVKEHLARAATRRVVAGGWAGSVYSASGIPVQAGIPGSETP